MTSERLFNSFIPPKNFYTPQNKFLATPLLTWGMQVLYDRNQKWVVVACDKGVILVANSVADTAVLPFVVKQLKQLFKQHLSANGVIQVHAAAECTALWCQHTARASYRLLLVTLWRCVRTDCGYKNSVLAVLQVNLQQDQHAHVFGTSPSNQWIEVWWAFLRRNRSQWWMELFARFVTNQCVELSKYGVTWSRFVQHIYSMLISVQLTVLRHSRLGRW